MRNHRGNASNPRCFELGGLTGPGEAGTLVESHVPEAPSWTQGGDPRRLKGPATEFFSHLGHASGAQNCPVLIGNLIPKSSDAMKYMSFG